jgi:hypothetical protein
VREAIRERIEWATTVAAAALLAAWLAVGAGGLGWSWDALNHHIYLGYLAQHPRWHLDVHAASVQSHQYAYVYWPAYLLSQWPGRPVVGAALWSGFQAAVIAGPIWLVCRRLLPEQATWAEAAAWRAAACAAAFMSLIVICALETTANDLLACVPLLWALALSLHVVFDDRRAAAAAALLGVAIAFKWSNGLALPWLLLWWYRGTRPRFPLRRGLLLAVAAPAGFALAYAPWGWQLWQVWGNPFFPLFDNWFRPA